MSHLIQLDSRLSLAFELYDPCDLAADIGTDHAHLPAALLQRGRCQRMILTDISESALRNARDGMIRFGLTRDILLSGKEKLQGASLVLSAHTDLPLIREAVRDIGYHLDREEPCICAGRYYLVLRARPGRKEVSDREIRLGGLLFDSASPQLVPYLARRRSVLEEKLSGLLAAREPDASLIARLRDDIAFYTARIDGHDRQ